MFYKLSDLGIENDKSLRNLKYLAFYLFNKYIFYCHIFFYAFDKSLLIFNTILLLWRKRFQTP